MFLLAWAMPIATRATCGVKGECVNEHSGVVAAGSGTKKCRMARTTRNWAKNNSQVTICEESPAGRLDMCWTNGRLQA